VRYWDASALVPIVLDEPGSSLVRSWLEDDPHVVTWAMTQLELASAVERRAREGRLSATERRAVLTRFDELARHWDEVVDLLAVRTRAKALLARHVLRAADAAQLGAALLAAEDLAAGVSFLCLDRGLARAAEREGFKVLTWPDEPGAG
jgi:hypothetical protein